MLGNHFCYSVHLHGTLAANARGEFKLPFPASLVAVSAGGSNANDAKLDVGTSADRDGILAAKDNGDSGSPTSFSPADFNGALATAGNPHHFEKGDIMTWDLDFDGAAGTAAQNVSLVFTFSEG